MHIAGIEEDDIFHILRIYKFGFCFLSREGRGLSGRGLLLLVASGNMKDKGGASYRNDIGRVEAHLVAFAQTVLPQISARTCRTVAEGIYQLAIFVATDIDDAMAAFEVGIAALDGNIHVGALVAAAYHVVAKDQREFLPLATVVFEHDNLAAIGGIGLTDNLFIGERKTFSTMRTD